MARLAILLLTATALCARGELLRGAHQAMAPEAVGDVGKGMSEGKIPAAGEEIGKAAGVDVPNPHKYLGLAIGGGAIGGLISLAIFCVATYFVYKWNKEAKAAGKEPYCGLLSVLCCLCCTPVTCCCPIDTKSES